MKIDNALPIQLNPELKTLSPLEQPTSSFVNFLTDAVGSTNAHLLAADTALQQLASGQATELHQTMLTLEEAKLSSQFLEQIRNRLMSAWQDVLKEQI